MKLFGIGLLQYTILFKRKNVLKIIRMHMQMQMQYSNSDAFNMNVMMEMENLHWN